MTDRADFEWALELENPPSSPPTIPATTHNRRLADVKVREYNRGARNGVLFTVAIQIVITVLLVWLSH